jgi:hypothetical protein
LTHFNLTPDSMSLFDSVKNLFGFTPTRPTQPVEPDASAETVAETPKPVSQGPPPAGQQRDRWLCILSSNAEEEEVYKVALWSSQPGKFQRELSRQLADNYIKLPADWRFEYAFYSEELPTVMYREGAIGLIVQDSSKPDTSPLLARLVTLMGQTEQAEYRLDPSQKTTFCIGRGHSSQTTSGRVRTNDIVILNEDDPGFDAQRGAGNGGVSRAHASIRYDAVRRQYSLLVDAGGLPSSGNKTKIVHPDERMERADIPGMGYPLQSGDQIELGGAVTLLFESL